MDIIFAQPSPIFSITMLIWYACIFFSPFVLISISKELKKISSSLEILTSIQLNNVDEKELTPEQIMKKYGVHTNHLGKYVWQNKEFRELDSAITAAKENT